MLSELLYLTNGNSKLANDTLIFSIPAGKTCPGANICLSMAIMDSDGKLSVKDGDETVFRCYAASQEGLYKNTYLSRAKNLQLVKAALSQSVHNAAMLIYNSILAKGTLNTKKVRIHESGDMFSADYLAAWCEVATMLPQLKFYCYSKNLPLFVGLTLPENFYMVASVGGKYDNLIPEYFPVYATVYNYLHEVPEGVSVDWDDSHCFGDKPFALLIHGVQPKGSIEAKASYHNRKHKKELKAVS